MASTHPAAASTFHIRAYGFTELAQAYFPHHTPRAACRTFGEWLRRNPRLSPLMGDDRRRRGRRPAFTPRQVGAIVSELGEP